MTMPATSAPSTGTCTTRHIVRTAMIMGLPYSIHLRRGAENDSAATDADIEDAVEAVWQSLRKDDAIFSTYRPHSDISRINRGEISVADAHSSVREVLELAALARRNTDGAFDVQATGVLDPSGIVKGWAASRAEVQLAGLGVDHYLNAGGDVVLRSHCAERPWRIGIEHPYDPSGLLAVVQAQTGAVATSGRSHRGGHISDPRTGLPAVGITQATVVGPSLLWADILATAAIAAGRPSLSRVHWPPGYEVLLVTDSGQLFGTPGLADHLAPDMPALAFAPLD